MPGHVPEAIANAFLEKPTALGRLTQMHLQKLVYIAHGWSLALIGDALVSEEPKAWDYGPVFTRLREHVKSAGREPVNSLIHEHDNNPFAFFADEGRGRAYRAELTPEEQSLIDVVWEKYGRLGAWTLSDLTHKPGKPWYKVYHEAGGRSSPIENKLIKEHYIDLANRARSETTA